MTSRKAKFIEILSPGKNLFYSKEAIKCGADSIYIGAPKFSLRYEHANTMEDIKELVDYAHRYWARVYIPLNCLLYSEDDIKTAQEMINKFYEMGIDGLIVQDIGILELDLPPIPIILSTNAMCYTKEDAQFFEKCGVKRIVVPRELTYDEIKDITDNSEIEIETFCYGFLCVGYSGNCYLAYVENLKQTKSSDIAHYKASNHGVCPERCMGNWTLKDANGNIIRENDRLFNLRFLNLYDKIEELVDIGVDSFKIAGREKDLKHVKNSTALFSMKANELCKKKGIKRLSSGRCILGFKPDFSKNFNKGFTDFFFSGRKKEMYSKYDIVGTPIGKVNSNNGNTFTVESEIKLNIRDRLRYQKGNNKVQTIEITDIQDDKYISASLTEDITGLELYRYIDVQGFKEVEESINYRVISVVLDVKSENDIYLISAKDEDNNEIKINYQKGTKQAEELYKLDTECEFVIDKVNIDGNFYIDDTEDLRTKIFEVLRKERAKNRPVMQGQVVKNNHPYYKKELTYLANVTNKMTKAFYERHGVNNIEAGLETITDMQGKRVFNSRYCLRNELGLCSKTNPQKLPSMPWTLEQLENGNKFKIEFDCNKCSMHLYLLEEGEEY